MSDAIILAPATAPLADAPQIDASLLTGRIAPNTLRAYTGDFAAYAAYAQGAGLDLVDSLTLARWRNQMVAESTYSPNTINRRLKAVRKIMHEAALERLITRDQADAFKDIAGVSEKALRDRTRPNARTLITPDDMRRICDAPDTTTLKGLRDKALLLTLASSGLRCSELAGLTVGQLVKASKGKYIMTGIVGKTETISEPRSAYISAEAFQACQRWLAARPFLSQTLFTSLQGRGRAEQATDKALSSVAVWQIVQSYAQACNLEHIKPHDFRRFTATEIIKKHDVRAAQKALGHKSIATTSKYDLGGLEPGLTDDLF